MKNYLLSLVYETRLPMREMEKHCLEWADQQGLTIALARTAESSANEIMLQNDGFTVEMIFTEAQDQRTVQILCTCLEELSQAAADAECRQLMATLGERLPPPSSDPG